MSLTVMPAEELAALIARAVAAEVAPLKAEVEALREQLGMAPNSPVLTKAEAARYLRMGVRRFASLVHQGQIAPRIGRGPHGALLFDKTELDRWLREHAERMRVVA